MEGDGIRVAGDGDVTLNAQYNKIIAGDEGIYIGETAGNGGNTVNIYLNATKEKEGYGNYIQANDNGIQNEGNAQITLRAETGHNYVEGSSNGIVVTEGVVRLISSEQNIIKAVQNGITVAGEDSNVILDGRYNTIAVNSSIVSDKVIDIVGLKANDGANIKY